MSDMPAATAEIDLDGRRRGAAAGLHRADARDARRPGRSATPTGCSRSSGTATGSRRSSTTASRQDLHPQRDSTARRTSRGCSRRRHGSLPSRRSSTARSSRSTRTARPTSACSRRRSAASGPAAGGAIARRRRASVYQAFDLLYLDGRSLLNVPLEDRKRLLRSVLRETGRVRFASHVEADGEAFHEAAERARPRGHRRQAPPLAGTSPGDGRRPG